MKNLKKFIVLILTLTFVIGLFIVQIGLCAEEEPIKVGFAARALDHRVFEIYRDTIKELAEKDGYEFVTTDAEMDPAKQMADIENMLTMGVNAFIVQTSNEAQLVETVRKINDAGKVVVMLDSDTAAGQRVFIGIDSRQMGVLSAEYVIEKLNGKGKVIIISGEPGNYWGINFVLGYNDVISKYPGIEVLVQQAADWNTLKALKVVQNLLIVHPDVDAFLCSNDQMGIGAIEALKNAGYKPGEVMVTGADGVIAAVELMKQGWFTMTVDKMPHMEAQTAYETLITIAKGGRVPCTYGSNGARIGVQPQVIDMSTLEATGFEGY